MLLIFTDGAFNLDAPPFGHGLQPIQQQIDQDLLNLVFVKHDFGEVLRLVQFDLDFFFLSWESSRKMEFCKTREMESRFSAG